MNLTHLLQLDITQAVARPHASQYVHLPESGTHAYLHTIYNPPHPDTLQQAATRLAIPADWQAFLQFQNGSALFFHLLSLYGVLESNSLVSRDPENPLPFHMERTNEDERLPVSGEWLQVGYYGYLGESVCISRVTSRIHTFTRKGAKEVATWPSAQDFLREEIARLSLLYSPAGELLASREFSSPSRQLRQ